MSAIKRSLIIWLGFQGLLWCIFGISYIVHREAWVNVVAVDSSVAAVGGWWTTLVFIVVNNAFICLIIAVGNIFVRFGLVTPGLLVLVMQAVMIGWMAGSNAFEIPFASVSAANLQFLKIGIWETTAYALICAVTLPKSLLVSETFPAKSWSKIRKGKDIKLDKMEARIVLLSALALFGAAIVETFAIFS